MAVMQIPCMAAMSHEYVGSFVTNMNADMVVLCFEPDMNTECICVVERTNQAAELPLGGMVETPIRRQREL